MTDKEKIRAEIERLKQYAESSKMEWIDDGYNQNAFAETCRISSFDKLLSFIDSLPEEPTPKGYDEAYLNECIAKASKTWEGVDVDKYMDEVRGRSPKESDDLEKAARMYAIPHYMKDVDENFLDEYPYDPVAEAAFVAGAEWQKERMMDEWLKDRDVCFWDGVEEGKKAMKKQMMEGAVEGEIVKDLHNLLHVKSGPLPMPTKVKFGDKVKIIILPNE